MRRHGGIGLTAVLLAASACGADAPPASTAPDAASADASTARPDGAGSTSSSAGSSGYDDGPSGIGVQAATLFLGATLAVPAYSHRGAGGPVAFTVTHLPTGVSAAPLSLENEEGALLLHASAEAALGTQTVVVHAGALESELALTVRPRAGALDPRFGAGGVSRLDLAGGHDELRGLALAEDGTLLAAGLAGKGDFTRGAVVRFLADGSFDPTFADGAHAAIRPGKILHDFGRQAESEEGTALVRAPSGQLVLAGNVTRNSFAAARFDAAGLLDASFGTAGNAVVALGAPQNVPGVVAVRQPDGKLVLAGSRASGAADDELMLLRLDAAGGLDPTFATGSFGAGQLFALAVQGDALLAGGTQHGTCLLVRVTATGALDPTVAAPDLGADCTIVALVAQADGSVIGATRERIFRLSPSGALDPTFGASPAPADGNEYRYRALTLAGDGSVVVTGTATTAAHLTYLQVTRFTPTGALDPGFGEGGVALAPTGSGAAAGNALVVQTDGLIVAGGGDGGDFLVARFWP